MRRISLFLIICFFGILSAVAQPGMLDSSFGNNGIVIGEEAGTDIYFNDMAILHNGKIIVVNSYGKNQSYGVLLQRFLADGKVDSTFGANGESFLLNSMSPSGLTIQPDGKILITGWIEYDRLIVLRFLPDGGLDSAFASNGSYIDNSGKQQLGWDLAIQNDGKVIVCGSWYKALGLGIIYPILVRLNPDGTPDNSFGENGEKIYTSFIINSQQYKIAVQEDGKILTSGYEGNGFASFDFYMVRYKQDGIPDSSFGVNGEVFTDFTDDEDYITNFLIEPDGKIIAAGTARANGFPRHDCYIAMAKYNIDGSLDQSFGIGGKTRAIFDELSQGYAVERQSNGKIIVAGVTAAYEGGYGIFAAARFNNNGFLDSSFGINGKTYTDAGILGDQTMGIGIQKDGDIVVGAVQRVFLIGEQDNTVLIRYLGDPTHPIITKIKKWIRHHILNFEDANPNTAYYVIEKSTTASGAYMPVTKINATAVNNTYNYSLPSTSDAITYYRIKAVNKDNSITYSSPISSSDPAIAGVASFKIYPNPAKDRITVETSGAVQLRLQNSNSRVLLTQTVNGKGSIDINKLPNGIYYVVNTVNGESLMVVKE